METSHRPLSFHLYKAQRRAFAFLAYFSGFDSIRQRWMELTSGPALRVIVYHRVNDFPWDKSRFTLTPSKFEEQLLYLKKNFRIITFSEAMRLRENTMPCSNAIVITFDDGYRDNFIYAFPILKKHGISACFFIITKLIGHNPSPQLGSEDYWQFSGMTWEELKILRDSGFEIGAHTDNHPNLTRIPLDEARREILESKWKLEKELGIPVRYFAYPIGKKDLHYNKAIKNIVGNQFDIGCTTNRGRNNFRTMDMLEINRIVVQNWWSLFYLGREAEGTFDFVGGKTFLENNRGEDR